jgi:hypothetical protein
MNLLTETIVAPRNSRNDRFLLLNAQKMKCVVSEDVDSFIISRRQTLRVSPL